MVRCQRTRTVRRRCSSEDVAHSAEAKRDAEPQKRTAADILRDLQAIPLIAHLPS
jgi:hypothetical protein